MPNIFRIRIRSKKQYSLTSVLLTFCLFWPVLFSFFPQNYLLALRYFLLFPNFFLLCLLSNIFDCSQIFVSWVCSPIFFTVPKYFLAGSSLQYFFWLGLPVVAEVRLSPLERYRTACFAQSRGGKQEYISQQRKI